MYERFTDRARRVMQLSSRQAQRFNHEYIGTEHILLGIVEEGSGSAVAILKSLYVELPGTEHLLLGLLREKEGVAGQVLMNFGVWLEDVRNEAAKLTVREQ